jgi:Na+/proline symporter
LFRLLLLHNIITTLLLLLLPSSMESRRGEEETKMKVPLLEAAKPPQVDDDSSLSLGRRAWEENKKLWVVAGPSIFTCFSSLGVTVISGQAFIGHIGPTELAAYALVSTVLMRFSNGILVSTVVSSITTSSSCSLTRLLLILFVSLYGYHRPGDTQLERRVYLNQKSIFFFAFFQTHDILIHLVVLI